MILIADSGSTKASWCLANTQGGFFFETEGYNPYFVDSDYMIGSLQKMLPSGVNSNGVTALYFYGAGCAPDKVHIIENALQSIFVNARCHVEDDMLAAARALLGNNAGFAAILGTGTNTCMYDGRQITHNIDSLGFILGDEGSGGSMGKRLIGDYIRETMPAELRIAFFGTYNFGANELIDHIYSQPMPNRFCAAFSRFLYDHIETAYAQKVVRDSFGQLFVSLVSQYPDYQDYTFNCVGSIGYYFRDILADVAKSYGMQLGRIIKSPITELSNYHLEVSGQKQ